MVATNEESKPAFKVEALHLFVEILPDGSEAIIQTGRVDPNTGQTHIMPLLTGSEKMADRLKVAAQLHCNETHRKAKHLKLTGREEIETIEEKLVKEAGPEAEERVNKFIKEFSNNR